MKHKKLLMLVAVVMVVALGAGVLAACNKDKDTGVSGYAGYSYRMGPSDLPTAWNIHTYQSNSATYILDYTTDGLYTFDYNEAGDGFKIVPSMASGNPVDVTSQYVGQYGVIEGDTNKVYSIPLKQNLKYDNGDPITANDFVESMKLLLNPLAANFRADTYYAAGDVKIYNAEEYVKQNTFGLFEFVSTDYADDEYVATATFTEEAGTGYLMHNNSYVVLDIKSGGNWGSRGLAYYYGVGAFDVPDIDATTGRYKIVIPATAEGDEDTWILTRTITIADGDEDYKFYDLAGREITRTYDEETETWTYRDADDNVQTEWAKGVIALLESPYEDIEAAAAANGQVRLTRALLKNLQDCIAMLHGYDNVEAYAEDGGDYAYIEFEEMAYLGRWVEEFDYEGNVGLFAADDYTLVLAMKKPLADNFYLYYNLTTDFFLVNTPLYKSCISTTSPYTNSYGTSVATYIGHGPYKLTTYVADSTIILEKNPYWHGYSEEEYVEGTYQTDRIVYTKVTNDATRLEMFLKGELDSYGLQAADMATYIASPYIYYTDTESTWYLAMNPDVDNLAEIEKEAKSSTGKTVVKRVLAIQEFRQALSYALDRVQFNLRLMPTSGVATGLLSAMIVADPESGATYRSLDVAKDAILEFWGLSDEWGDGKEYATRDEAIASITGYDPEGAMALFDAAYTKADTAGYIPAGDDWVVQIIIGMPSTSSSFYTNGAEFLTTQWTNAVVGTQFEGHLEFIQSQELGSTSFGSYLRNGLVDLLFGVGYGGSMFNPYSFIECFTGSLQYDSFTDKNTINMDVTYEFVDGEGAKTYRASLFDWVSKALQGTEITAYEVDTATGETVGSGIAIDAGANADPDMRIAILAAAEVKILTLSNIFPLQTDASASLKGMRINYKTEEYIVGLGRGGIKYYTYEMNDAQFAAFVRTQPGGVLNYAS